MNTETIVSVLILSSVMEADLGHRKVTAFRLLRTPVLVMAIVPFFLKALSWTGHGVYLEAAAIITGILLGLFATRFIRVYWHPTKKRVYSYAAVAYALFWLIFSAARLYFTYGSQHQFGRQLGEWMMANQISVAALTDSLILVSVTPVLIRSASLAIRYRKVKFNVDGPETTE